MGLFDCDCSMVYCKIYIIIFLLQVEANLRQLGFGYRAKFIQKSASQIIEFGGDKWFKSLQDMEYNEARQELMKLTGIGPKVTPVT